MRCSKLQLARRLTYVLDNQFQLPFRKKRFGLDSLIGLMPVVGDVLPACCLGYYLWLAWRLKAPAPLYTSLILNTVLDVLIGLLPLVGDFGDVLFKSHSKNLALLEAWEAQHWNEQAQTPPPASSTATHTVIDI